jgi:hypothetical protein
MSKQKSVSVLILLSVIAMGLFAFCKMHQSENSSAAPDKLIKAAVNGKVSEIILSQKIEIVVNGERFTTSGLLYQPLPTDAVPTDEIFLTGDRLVKNSNSDTIHIFRKDAGEYIWLMRIDDSIGK